MSTQKSEEVEGYFSSYIHLSKYARFLDEEGRRETWEETVSRYTNFFRKRYPELTKELDEVHEAILTKKVAPSMRALMTSGKALERCNTVGYNCAAVGVDHPRVFDEIFYLLMGGSGVGFSVASQHINKLPVVAESFHDTQTTIVVQDSRAGWAKALKELVSLLYNGDIPKFDTSLIRPSGARLRTMGGRASGPKPLLNLFNSFIRVFKLAKGRRLNSLEVHDLICTIADTVIVGSVRRSACISFSDVSDERMRSAKSGQWYLDPTTSIRALANNSAMYTEKPDLSTFMKEMRGLYTSKSGERGIVNQEALRRKAAALGREHDGVYLLNPCVTGDTLILTDSGYEHIETLVGRDIKVWNGEEFSDTKVFSTGVNDIISVEVSNGATIDCTPYHKFILKDGSRKEAKDLVVGDSLVDSSFPVLDLHGSRDDEELEKKAYTQGFYAGDGHRDSRYSKLYSTKYCCKHRLLGHFGTDFGNYIHWNHGDMMKKSFVPMWESLEYKLNWLAGLLDSDGNTINNPNSTSLVITSIDEFFLNKVRLLLTTMGCNPKVVLNRVEAKRLLPDGKGGKKEYTCKAGYRIQINTTDTAKLKSLGLKCERLDLFKSNPQRCARRFLTITSVKQTGRKEETFCFTEPKRNAGVFNGVLTGQCGEAVLKDTGGLCNLTELVVRSTDTLEDLKEKVRIATIIGTLQSTLTDFKYLRKVWKTNAEEERLLGVSMTGIMDHDVMSGVYDRVLKEKLRYYLRELKSVAKETNKEWSEKLGIQESKQIGLIKPSGTVSSLMGTSSGIHPRYSPFYIRRVTQDNKDPLTQLMIDQGIPHVVVKDKVIFEFLIKSPETSVMRKDLSPIDQLELWKIYAKEWCDGNPSQTIYYDDSSFLSVCDWVYRNWDDVVGLSFFPSDDNVYPNQPFEEISEEEYREKLSRFPTVDFSLLKEYEKDDASVGMNREIACSGGQCEL